MGRIAAWIARRRAGLALQLGLVAASLLGLELLTRAAVPQQLVPGFYVADSDAPYLLRPNHVGEQVGEHYVYTVRTNNLGFRMDEDIDPAADRPRAILAGDSFTFGWGVELEESFAGLLAHRIQGRHPQVQLVNAGVGGNSTGHSLRGLKKTLELFDACAAAYFFQSNDPVDNLKTDVDYRVTEYRRAPDGSIELADVPRYRPLKRFILGHTPYGWLKQNSHLLVLARNAAAGVLPRGAAVSGGAGGPEVGVRMEVLEIDPERARLMVDVTEAHVRRFASFAAGRDLRLATVWIPSWAELFDPDRPGVEVLRRIKRRFARIEGLTLLDPTRAMQARVGGRYELLDLFFEDGRPVGHFTPLGNALFAESIGPEFEAFVASACPG